MPILLKRTLVVMIVSFFFSTVLPAIDGAEAKDLKLMHRTSIYTDAGSVGLKFPEGVALDRTGSRLIVADTGNARLLAFTIAGDGLKPEGGVFSVPALTCPLKVKFDSRGRIWVLDGKTRKIERLNSTGEYDGQLTPFGLPTAQEVVVRNFTLDGEDTLYVLDVQSAQVLVLDVDGRYRRNVAFPEDHGFFSDLAVDAQGNLLLLDSVGSRVFKAGPGGDHVEPLTEGLQAYLRFPTAIDTDDRGRIYLVDRNGGQVIVLGKDGRYLSRQSAMGWKEGRLNFPSQIDASGDGQILIADTRNHRVQFFSVTE